MIAMVAFRGGRWYNCCWCPFGSLMCAELVVALSGGGVSGVGFWVGARRESCDLCHFLVSLLPSVVSAEDAHRLNIQFGKEMVTFLTY